MDSSGGMMADQTLLIPKYEKLMEVW